MSAWLGVAILFSLAVVLILGRKIGLTKGYKKREKMTLVEILEVSGYTDSVNPVIYKDVVEKLADSVKLDFGLIRPGDKLDDLFGRDSWELGEGQERFENWLLAYAGDLQEFKNVSTVAELVCVIQQSKLNNA